MNEQHIEDSYPLSPLQQGLLFHSLFAPQSGIHTPQMIWNLHEDLNISAFKQAWEQVVKRHPILRTSFHFEGLEVPLQKVHRQVKLPLIREDWRGLSAQEQESRLENYLHTDLRHDFELTKAPLMRLALFQISETEYQFIWTYHHALLDGHSRLLIVKEIFAYYEAYCQGDDLQLKQPRPYRAHIEWLQQQNMSKAKTFWQQTLKGFSAPTRLIQDQVTDSILAREEFDITEMETRLSKADTSALKSLAQQHGLTLNTVLQGAWVLLLSRYSRSEDVVFGATRACRHSTVKEAKNMVGLFINVLPIRVQVSPEMLLIPWLKKIRAHWIRLREYEQTSSLKIQEWSDIPPGTPLFESTHDFRYSSVESALREQGGKWKRREFRILHQSNVPLAFHGFGETELLLRIKYNPSRFDVITIERMLRHFKTLLEGMIANPKRRLLDLPLLTETDRSQLLVEWNDTQATYPQDQCIHQLFEAQAGRTPDALAVVFEDKQITYRELNSKSNQWAHYLRMHGVGSEQMVGICMERCLEMIVGLLAILKAGGAYVAFEPDFTRARLSFMLEDTKPGLLLTQERLLEKIPAYSGKVVCLDRAGKLFEDEQASDLGPVTTPENLAYVTYTSGSTGRPKGILTSHRNVVQNLHALIHSYSLSETDIVLQIPSFSFDASVRNMLGPLLAGARIVVVRNDEAKDPSALVAKITENQVNCILSITPSLLTHLIEACSHKRFSFAALRHISATGEPLPMSLCKRVQDVFGCSVVNQYGPTECTMISSYHRVVDLNGTRNIALIGRPIANTQFYILDDHLNPVPIGVAGEAYIGGLGVSKGYLNLPDLTAEKFIPNPFSNEPGARLYKTGDMVRYLPDGTMEFLGRIEALLNYWKDKLGGELPVLKLPTDRPRPAVQTHRVAIESLALSKALSEALQAMSRREGVTLFMTLLAAFKTLLYRHTGQEDIVVGTPIAGRNRTELEGQIGYYMNTIVMRTDLSGQLTFRELLGRVRETVIGAYAHQDMPFEKVVEELAPERDLSRTPLFQVFFNHIVSMGEKAAELPGLESEAVGGFDHASKFDMTLYVLEHGGCIALHLVYNIDLFDASTITWMLAHFESLCEGIVDDPGQCISALPLLTAATRQQLSTKGNTIQLTKSYTNIKAAEIDQSLPSRFVQQVKSYPDNIAVKTRKYEWTYQELNLEANRIAKRVLTECGDKEERIALLFGHDAPMVASLFGALKAGKTYVPLDPSYPVERLAYILEDSNACAVLTDSLNVELAEGLAREKLQIINIDAPQSTPPLENVDVSVTPEALAYILYTSGSTGRPKGVMQNHRNVMHFIRVYTNNLHISEDDRLTLISSYSFDGAIMDIFGALLNGATLYPINIKEETAEGILQWLIDQEMTLYHSTPTVYRYLLGYLDPPRKLSLMRLVVLGGEEVFRRDVELYQQHFEPDCLFINGLGPSESTVTLQYLINGDSAIRRTAVPVGYPVDETEILLLTETGEAAEVYGEIAIRSPYIALGYWQQPELSDKVFLPDPEGGSRRIYRSGDLGRLLPDGSIEFAGRKDAQVKIRGIRIEVGEVEVVLGQHPAVSEVVVVPGEPAHGDRQLVAYLVISAQPSPSIAEIRGFLQQKLPDYMIPSVFMFLDALPRTPNGKVDHRALPEPDLERSRLETEADPFVAPRDALDLQLAKIWEKVLGVQNIRMEDNFFDLGGHSLLAVNLFARIRKIFGRDLPMTALFQAPTIRRLASIIRQEGVSSPWSSLVPIQPDGARPPFFCIHGCNGRVLHFYDLARHLGSDQPFYGLTAKGREDDQDLHPLIEEMAAHYIKEIRTVQFDGPYFIGASGAGCFIALEMAHQLESQGENVALIVYLTPAVAQSNSASSTFPIVRSLWKFYRRILIFMQTRPFIPTIRFTFANRILYRWKILHRFVPIEIHRRRRFLKIFSEALSNYTPEAYHGRIACILRDEFARNPKKGLGEWSNLSFGGLDVRFIPGNILSMWREPHVKILAAQLRSCLDEAQTKN